MKHLYRTIPFILVLFASCAGGTGDDSAQLPLESGAEHYLVWWAVEEGGHTTALVRAGREGHEVVAEGEGLLVAAGETLWSWEESVVETQQADCECVMASDVSEEPPADCGVKRETPVAELVALDGDKVLQVGPRVDSFEGEYEPTPSVLGSSGPYLMALTCSYGYSCGAAHGNVDCEWAAWNLETAAEMEPSDFVVSLSEADQIAMLQTDSDEEVDAESLLGMVTVRPDWNEAGELVLHAMYATSTCYACGDGEWASYTTTARHENATPALEFEDAPAPVVASWGTAAAARGWSRLPESELQRATDYLRSR